MNRFSKRRCGIVLILLLFAVGILFSLNRLFHQEVFAWMWKQREYQFMLGELALLFTLFYLIGIFLTKNSQKFLAVLLVLSCFLWIHQVLVPVVASGLYLAYVFGLGRFFRRFLWKLPENDGWAADFLTGTALLLCVFCLMSALGIGGIKWLTEFVMVSGGGLAVFFVFWGKRLNRAGSLKFSAKCSTDSGINSTAPFFRLTPFLLAFLLTMLCIQAGRANIAIDYDSLWYGVRSAYILDNGKGIYENLGTIGVVYTYPKGFEVLTLPLSALPSASFLTCVNLWLAGAVLFMGYQLGRFYLKREQALFLAVLLSANPGIMNMAVTAKSDMITLLFQEILLYYLFSYAKEGGKSRFYLCYALSAFLISLTLKPTAPIFSSAIFGTALLFFLCKGDLRGRFQGKVGKTFQRIWRTPVAVALISFLALIGISIRTLIITGLPITSVYSSLLTRLGFSLKYPFAANSLSVGSPPNTEAGLPFSKVLQTLFQYAKRLYGFFLCPVGEEMDHVLLAWGGFQLTFLFLLWFASRFWGKNEKKKTLLSLLLPVLYFPFLFGNLLSLLLLAQIDGNYFMLLYVLTGLCALKAVGENKAANQVFSQGIKGAGAAVLLVSLFLTTLTNWSWTLGFSPPALWHRGYYDHREAARQDMSLRGNETIWNILAENKQTRLIAVGEHPRILQFPCSVQSYDDITGVWGNVYLVKKMDYFVEFMNYAKTDYIYLQAGYAGEKDRAYTLISDLIEWGKLVPVCYENGNLLAKVELKGGISPKSQEEWKIFQREYEKKN